MENKIPDTEGTQMVRAVSPHWGSDFTHGEDGRACWVVDTSCSAHRAPFHVGDVITDDRGWKGFHEVREVDPHPDDPRLLRLVVKRAGDLVFDDKAF